MADLTITAASVVAGTNANIERGTFGETVTAGQAVYKDSTTQKYMRADANSATAAARDALGIALNSGALNQPGAIQKSGKITIGATLTAGTDYYLSPNPGGICPRSDVVSGVTVCLLGLAESTAVLDIDIQFPNVTL